MPAHRVAALLLLGTLSLASCSTGAQPLSSAAPPTGLLGYTIGTYLRLEGQRESAGKSGPSTLRVARVNGAQCPPNTTIWLENLTLPDTGVVRLSGYETGRWIGVPQQVLEAEHTPARQAAWQFQRYFIVTSVQAPAELATTLKQSNH